MSRVNEKKKKKMFMEHSRNQTIDYLADWFFFLSNHYKTIGIPGHKKRVTTFYSHYYYMTEWFLLLFIRKFNMWLKKAFFNRAQFLLWRNAWLIHLIWSMDQKREEARDNYNQFLAIVDYVSEKCTMDEKSKNILDNASHF